MFNHIQSTSIGLPKSETITLFNSLKKTDSITKNQTIILQQINTLEYAGLIPSKEALLLKNNLSDNLFAEGILSDLVLRLIKQGKLAPEMKSVVNEKHLEKTIALLYTSHLEQAYSTLDPVHIQQRIWKASPKEFLSRMQEAEEMESKKYVKEWLHSLQFLKQECQTALAPLLKPLTDSEFKTYFLAFIDTLQLLEEDLTHQFCLEELYNLLKNQSETTFLFTLSQFLKAHYFYENHILSVEKNLSPHQDPQLSLFIAADAIKNAPHSKQLPTYYSLIYGKIKKSLDNTQTGPLNKPIAIIEGHSPDEKTISHTIQELFKKASQDFFIIDLKALKTEKDYLKTLAQIFSKKNPQALVAPISYKDQHLLLEASKKFGPPLVFFPSYTKTSDWEEASNDSNSLIRIGFPTPLNVDFLEEINKEKTKISGIPGLFQNTASKEFLKKKWGFSPQTKIVVIHTPEGNSPWPAFLAKEYSSHEDLTILVLTDAKNKSFIHTLKTKISPHTQIPLKIYSSLSPLEKEEILTLSDLIIDKEREQNSSLLFEASHAKTPILLDHSHSFFFSGGPIAFLKRLFHLQKDSHETEIHENLLNDLNLGIMIRSKKNFKLAFNELLFQDPPSTISPDNLKDTLFPLLQEMKEAAESKDLKEKKNLPRSLHFFTTR